MEVKIVPANELQEQTLATIILQAEACGITFMGDQMIGYKFVDGPREVLRVWNMILEKFMPDGFVFTQEFFDCYGIDPFDFDSEKWNEKYGTRF